MDMRMLGLGTAVLAVGVVAFAGCSLIYNPSNLPGPAIDAGIPIDAPTIVDPDKLVFAAVGPQVLLEGQGMGGSRPAILTILGTNIAQDAVVALVPADGTTPAPMIQVDNDNAVRSLSGTSIAVPVILPIDTGRAAGDLKLTIQITQMGRTESLTFPMTTAMPAQVALQVTLKNLPELDAVLAAGVAPAELYSRVKIQANMSVAPGGTTPIVIRAVSSIDLKDVHVDASGATPGPGGASGGAATKPGAGPGGGKPGALVDLTHLSLLAAGSGGGYGQAGGNGKATVGADNAGGGITGDEQLRSFTANGGSGGGGGGTNPGGGAGGSIEITAGGTLTAGVISANGAAGGADAALSGAAGGGSGGAILLRSGAPATLGMVTANGGAAGSHGNTGAITAGDGGGGRLRYDLAKLAGTPALPVMRRPGVSFSTAPDANPLVTQDRQQAIALDGAVSAIADNNLYDLYVLSAAQATTSMLLLTFGTPSLVVKPTLTPGYNRICVTPHGLNPLTDLGSTNCIDIAYVP